MHLQDFGGRLAIRGYLPGCGSEIKTQRSRPNLSIRIGKGGNESNMKVAECAWIAAQCHQVEESQRLASVGSTRAVRFNLHRRIFLPCGLRLDAQRRKGVVGDWRDER